MATADSKTSSAVASGGYKDRFWIPRFWDGITISGWFGILWRNRFAVTPRRIAMSLIIVGLSLFNFVLWLLQTIFYGRTIAKTVLKDDPLFVVGHWRSGTTMLHEMLVSGRPSRLRRHLRLFRTESLFIFGMVFKAPGSHFAAIEATDGQHGCRLGSSAGGRIRPLQYGRPFSVFDRRFSESAPAGSGVFRSPKRTGRRRSVLEGSLFVVPPLPDGKESETDRVKVTAPHLPD